MRTIEYTRKYMNTDIRIAVVAADEDKTTEVQDQIELAFGEFDRIVGKYTRFADTSELSKLNARSGEWVQVSEEFMKLIKYMLELAAVTNGAFDPTVIDLLEAYGYSSSYDFETKLGDPELEHKIRKIITDRPSWRAIEINDQDHKVKLAGQQRIELGAIGKGYAMDCAFKHLGQFDNFLISAGGDIVCRGHNENDEPWQIGLKHIHEEQEGYIGKVDLRSGSLCSSGSWARRVENFHHLIDSVTGKPHEKVLTVFTRAPRAMQADAWSTVLFLMGKKGLDLMPSDVGGMVIDSKNKMHRERFEYGRV